MKAKRIYMVCLTLALASTLFGQTETKDRRPAKAMEPYYDLRFTESERDSLFEELEDYAKSYKAIHGTNLENNVPMALYFNPLPAGFSIPTLQNKINWALPEKVEMPDRKEDLAFYPVYKLAALIKTKKITSTELTKIYLDRLKKFSDTLICTVTITEVTALEQSRKADEEIAKGKYRGPLHGIPYGIKDLLAVAGTKTTWGAGPYKDQEIDATATVVKKLNDAGAVMVAKLSMGALAMGDLWFQGRTKNPWNLKQGSSGSSAGSASATSAGLVAFAIGTETWGSIVSPATRCGVTGLRPTFGAVSRNGAMTLSWSMDKIGPICRSALDCAIIFDIIRGQDRLDKTVNTFGFNYDSKADAKKLKVGYFKTLFDKDTVNKINNERALEIFRSLGIKLQPVEMPGNLPVDALSLIITAEGAAAFDDLTRSNHDSLLTDQRKGAWPNIFRTARFIPAVEYINAMRIRQQLIEEYHKALGDYDVIISPTFGGNQTLATNLTGHPCLVMPDGFNRRGSPTSISLLGKLYGEAALILLGRAYQEASEWDEKIPPYFK